MFKTSLTEQIKDFATFIFCVCLTILAFSYTNLAGLIFGITGLIMSVTAFIIMLYNFNKIERALLILCALLLIFILLIKTL